MSLYYMYCQIASYFHAIREDITNEIDFIFMESKAYNLWLCTVFCPVRNPHMKYQRKFSANINIRLTMTQWTLTLCYINKGRHSCNKKTKQNGNPCHQPMIIFQQINLMQWRTICMLLTSRRWLLVVFQMYPLIRWDPNEITYRVYMLVH